MRKGMRKNDKYEYEVEDEDRKRNQGLKNNINNQIHFLYFVFYEKFEECRQQKGKCEQQNCICFNCDIFSLLFKLLIILQVEFCMYFLLKKFRVKNVTS